MPELQIQTAGFLTFLWSYSAYTGFFVSEAQYAVLYSFYHPWSTPGQSWTSQLWSSWQDREDSIRIHPSSTSPCSTLSFVQAPRHQNPVQVCPWGHNCKPSIASLYQSQYLAVELWSLILRWFLATPQIKGFLCLCPFICSTFSYTCH